MGLDFGLTFSSSSVFSPPGLLARDKRRHEPSAGHEQSILQSTRLQSVQRGKDVDGDSESLCFV
jgi:hypothetical protein